MHLKPGTLLQSGKYKIEKVLGQGSFGITYLATTKIKVGGNLGKMDTIANVAIKEFFMRDLNGREGGTVTHSGNGELFADYKSKFVKEAIKLSELNHPNIIKVLDLFEENNTSYYVMEYCSGGSLDNKIKRENGLNEKESVRYAKQIGKALKYMHSKKMLHLDLKPGNVVLNDKGDAVLIDFGLSKQFDSNGEPESSTTIGLGTPGYAPIEQSNYDGKGFPVTMDVYAMGATLYKILTGETPQTAPVLFNSGFPYEKLREKNVSEDLIAIISKAMKPMLLERCQSIEEFLKALEFKEVTEDEGTDIEIEVKPDPKPNPTPTPNPVPVPVPGPTPRPKSWVLYAVLALVLGIGSYFVYDIIEKRNAEKARIEAELAQAQKEASYKEMLSDNQSYITLIGEGDKLLSVKKYSESINKYEQAQIYEKKYTGTEYSKEFDKGASAKIREVNEAERAYKAEQARLEKERKEREAAEKARLEKERKEREAAEKARIEKERKEREAEQEKQAFYNRTHGSKSGHDWVDLGLPSGIKWATSNVGASRPEEYGYYFAWGETREKTEYRRDNSVTFGKDYGDIGGDSRYDAARANWGGSWRLPTEAEIEELKKNCTWSWTTQGGKKGYKVTGPNGNSIFLPAAGYRRGTKLNRIGMSGYYWSSSPDWSDADDAYILFFDSGSQNVGWGGRYDGQSVRPVSE